MNENKTKLEWAVYYQSIGLNIIPVGPNKKALIKWEEYQNRCSTIEEINGWWSQWPEANIALITGKVSDVVALDIDKKHNRSSKEFTLPPTMCAKSGGGGEHFFFKYPKTGSVKSGSAIHGEGIDCRGDGGYILLAPSVNEAGGVYEWLIPFESKDDLAEMPEWFLKLVNEEQKEKKWLVGKDGVQEGSRNDTATSMAGKILSSTVPELWEGIGWEQLKVWNQKNSKPLNESELRGIWESIMKRHVSDNFSEIKQERNSQADKLIEIVEKKENVTLFHDDRNDAYISVKIGDHQEIIPLKSKAMKRWLTKEFWDVNKKAVNPDSVKSAIAVLEGKACFDGESYKLHNRLAWSGKDLWYDLTDDKWQAVKINENGWQVINKPPILFSRYSHSQGQVIPTQENGDARLILKYINITNVEQQLLLLIYLVSCFLPDFPHPILVIFGSQGSAKSTLSKLLRRIVDPSQIEVASMPDNHKELVQALAHHTFLFFDNVSYISESASDTLCKAITGSGFVKRELYSDDDDIIYRFKRCIGINGINLVSTRPDLLDRSLLLELERIDDSKRKQEKELMEDFDKDLPIILSGVFNMLSKTLSIKPTIKLNTSPRMADFTIWGCAIAEALGYKKEEFISAYQNNIDKQKETILNENTIAMVLISFMEERSWEKWESTMSELLERLTQHAPFVHVSTYDKHWPKAPNALSRALNILKITLRSADVAITNYAGQSRKIIIEKVSTAKTERVIPPITNSLLSNNDTDDNDDISGGNTRES